MSNFFGLPGLNNIVNIGTTSANVVIDPDAPFVRFINLHTAIVFVRFGLNTENAGAGPIAVLNTDTPIRAGTEIVLAKPPDLNRVAFISASAMTAGLHMQPGGIHFGYSALPVFFPRSGTGVSVASTSTSASLSLNPHDNLVYITNESLVNTVFVRHNTSAAATTADTPIYPGLSVVLSKPVGASGVNHICPGTGGARIRVQSGAGISGFFGEGL